MVFKFLWIPQMPSESILTLSTSLVNGLEEFQLHHFLWSWGRGGRRSWKVRTLHARGRVLLVDPAWLLGVTEDSAGSGVGQSKGRLGPVSLCLRKRSRCYKRQNRTHLGEADPVQLTNTKKNPSVVHHSWTEQWSSHQNQNQRWIPDNYQATDEKLIMTASNKQTKPTTTGLLSLTLIPLSSLNLNNVWNCIINTSCFYLPLYDELFVVFLYVTLDKRLLNEYI